jgi:hypothetical protein
VTKFYFDSVLQASFINWQTLNLRAIPFAPGQLDFTLFDRQFRLLQAAKLGVLEGELFIQKFSFSTTENNDDPIVHFKGWVDNLSLEQLSRALNWEPLTGSISGYIQNRCSLSRKVNCCISRLISDKIFCCNFSLTSNSPCNSIPSVAKKGAR